MIINVVYPAGCGGNWLQNLIYNLQNNIIVEEQDNVHFHRSRKPFTTEHVLWHHMPDKKNCIVFSDWCKFNFYLNVTKKHFFHELKVNEKPFNEQLKIITDSAEFVLKFEKVELEHNIDLHYTDIFLDPAKFTKDIFDTLDRFEITHHKNIDIVKASIDSFKKTCIRPDPHISHWDSIYWLGWCSGIIKHHNLPLEHSIESMTKDQLIDEFKNYNQLFDYVTKMKSLRY